MMRNDSASVISTLQMDYGDSDDDEETGRKSTSRNNSLVEEQTSNNSESDNKLSTQTDKELVINSNLETEAASENVVNEEADDEEEEAENRQAELISDDEDGTGLHHHHRPRPQDNSQPQSEADLKQAVAEAVNPESPSSQGSVHPRKKARLVSYGRDDEDLDEDRSDSDDKENSEDDVESSPEHKLVDTATLSRSVRNMSSDEIRIPPEPVGKCSYQLQKKIDDMYERMRREGMDLNRVIQSKKNFRNPSIYEKLIDYCHIDEKGTNFPPEIYDPHIWGKESFYDELDKVQRKDMERREKEKKTKIEFMTGTKKPASAADTIIGPSDEKKRKTKWDAQPAALIHVSKIPSASQNPGVVNLTSMATGTKATIIPAIGSLSKKPPSLGK